MVFPRQGAHQFADDAQHDFVGAAADRHQAHVAIGPRYRVVPHKAHAAPILQAAVTDFAAQAPGLEFGHGRQAGHVLALDVLLGGLVHQRPQAFDFGAQFGQTKMDHLVVDQRLAEGLALLAIVDGAVDAVLQALDHVGRAEQAFFLELQHLHHETRAFMADAVALWHAHAIEEHLGGFGAVHAELFQGRADADTGGVHGHHDQ